MLRKIRRQIERLTGQARARMSVLQPNQTSLRLENLENRVLLDVSGLWDEIGWRSASGGGVSYDEVSDNTEAVMAISSDGDPVVIWVDSSIEEWIEHPIEYGFQGQGDIYARQFAGQELGWWDLRSGSGDLIPIGSGGQLDVATGPKGQIVLVWNDLNGGVESTGEIHTAIWDGTSWRSLTGIDDGTGNVTYQTEDILSNPADGVVHEHPSVAYSPSGEIFYSYTAVHPETGQREIIVQKFGYTYENDETVGPPTIENLGFVELVNEDVNTLADFSGNNVDTIETFGMSNDESNSFYSSIAVDLDGRPIVAWTDLSFERNSEIFVRRWDGDSWEELGIESASDSNEDGNAGVSNDGANMSMQPDVVMTPSGDVIVTWVEWQNWEYYQNDGQAAVYVKVLRTNSSVWDEYTPGSASGAGITDADANGAATGSMGLGWYYTPEVIIDQDNEPIIIWQGFGSGERLILQLGTLPWPSVYLSEYEDGAFQVKTENSRGTINDWNLAWMPSAVLREDPENPGEQILLVAYTQHDNAISGDTGYDNEIFVETWSDTDGDGTKDSWVEYGKGSASNGPGGNLGVDPDNLNEQIYENIDLSGFLLDVHPEISDMNIDVQTGLYDHDNDDTTEPYLLAVVPSLDVTVNNNAHAYLYNRNTGKWSNEVDTLPNGIGRVFELKGDPKIQYQLNGGAPLLAYLDDITGLPFVYEFVGGEWNLIGDTAASPIPGEIEYESITVQAGPDGKILLAYVEEDNAANDIITRLWNPEVGAWADAESGKLKKDSELEVTYFSEFTGWDWDRDGELTDGTAQNNGLRSYVPATWAGWDVTDDTGGYNRIYNDNASHDLIEWSVADTGFLWVDEQNNDRTQGLEMEFTVPVDDFENTNFSTENLIGEFDYSTRMLGDGYVVVEMMYELDTSQLPNASLSMYLDFWDTADSRNAAIVAGGGTPTSSVLVDSIAPGSLKTYSSQSTHDDTINVKRSVTLDTKELGFNPMTADEGNIISIRFVADVEEDDLQYTFDQIDGGNPDAEGWTFVDASGNAYVEGDLKNYADENDGYYIETFNTGNDDVLNSGGIEMKLLGQSKGVVITDEDSYYENEFYLGGPVDIDVSYQLLEEFGGANLAAGSSIVLMISIDGFYITSADDGGDLPFLGVIQDDVANPVDNDWDQQTISLDEDYVLGTDADGNPVTLEPGKHTIRLEPRLLGAAGAAATTDDAFVLVDNILITPTGDQAYKAYGRVDNVSIYQRMSPETNTVSVDIDGNPVPIVTDSAFDQTPLGGADPNLTATGIVLWANTFGRTAIADDGTGIAGVTDGGLQMTFGNGLATSTNITNEISYDFGLPATSNEAYLDLDFDMLALLGDDIANYESMTISVRVDDADAGTTVLDLGTFDLVSDNGTTDTTGWRSWKGLGFGDPGDFLLPALDAGNYQLVISATLSSSAIGAPDAAGGQGFLYLDNLDLDLVEGYSQWEFMPREGSTAVGAAAVGGNNQVGLQINGTAWFDDANGTGFQGNYHAGLIADAGTQTLLIEDIVNGGKGQMEIGFRLRTTGDEDLLEPSFFLDGGVINVQAAREGEEYTTLETIDIDYLIGSGLYTVDDVFENFGWWNNVALDPVFSLVKIRPDTQFDPGTYTYRIEMVTPATGSSYDLWVDNVYVLAATQGGTSQQRPIATLAPTQGDTREFVIGVTNESQVKVYPTADQFTDTLQPWNRANITHYTSLFNMTAGYTSSQVYRLDVETQLDGTVVETWEDYLDKISSTRNLDLLGVGDFQADAQISMPSSILYSLEGLTFGPRQLMWQVTQRSTTEYVDTDNDGENDNFDLHSHEVLLRQPWWNEQTTEYNIDVWRWANVPDDFPGDPTYVPQWVNVGLQSTLDNGSFFNAYPSIVSTGDQQPIVMWSSYNDFGSAMDVHAQTYEGNGIWGIYGQSERVDGTDVDSTGAVGLQQNWGIAEGLDLLATPDGDPIITLYNHDLASLGIREFRKTAELPTIEFTESSGTQNDNLLDFETQVVIRQDEAGQQTVREAERADTVVTMRNTGNGDLLIYDVDFGGVGNLGYNPFSVVNLPDDFPGTPIVLESIDENPGERLDWLVRFNPMDPSTQEPIPAGLYEAVMLVYHSAPNSIHPFGHFHEIVLRAEVVSQAELTVDDDDLLLPFDKRIIEGGGLSNLQGQFGQNVDLDSRGDLEIQFDYQVQLTDGLQTLLAAEDGSEQNPLTFNLIVSADGVDIAPDEPNQFVIDRDNYQTVLDSFQTATVTAGNLSKGIHEITFRAELSRSLDGDYASVQLDNIQFGEQQNYNFTLKPKKNEWIFTPDERDPEFTTGDWVATAGVTGGGLDMILGQPEQIETVEISNTGTESFTITQWLIDGTAFNIENAVLADFDTDSMMTTETDLPTLNSEGAADDVVIGPGDKLTLSITFEPLTVGFMERTLLVTSDLEGSEITAVRLGGTGRSGADIQITYDGDIIEDFNTATAQFDQIVLGTVRQGTTQTITFTVSNVGSTDLTIDSMLENNNIETFLTISPSIINPLVLTPGASQDFTLTYSPDIDQLGQIEELMTRILITNDSAYLSERIYEFEVVGTAVPDDVTLMQIIDPETRKPFLNQRIDFGTVLTNQTVTQTFQIDNVGGTDLVLERFIFIGQDGFSGDDEDVITIDPQNPIGDEGDIAIDFDADPYTVTLTFSPDHSGILNRELWIFFIGDEGKPITSDAAKLAVDGVVVSQQMNVTDSQGDSGDGLINFGTIPLNQTDDSYFVTVTNVGTSTITIDDWSFTGDDAFTVEAFADTMSLSPGASTFIDVSFVPDEAVNYSGTIVISSDNSTPSTWEIALAGKGGNPGTVITDQSELNFGAVIEGSQTTRSFTITNAGESRLDLLDIMVPSNFFEVNYNPGDNVLDPGEILTVNVTFMPVGLFDSQTSTIPMEVRITTDDLTGGEPALTTVSLLGQSLFTTEVTNGRHAWVDDNGKVVQIVVSNGTAKIIPFSISNNDIGMIEIAKASSKTSVTIIGPQTGTTIGGITGTIARNIILKNVTIDGDMDNDGVEDLDYAIDFGQLTGVLMMNDVVDGADIHVGQTGGRGLKIIAGTIGDESRLTIDDDVNALIAESFGAPDSQEGVFNFEVHDLNVMQITNGSYDARTHALGDINAVIWKGSTASGDLIAEGDINKVSSALTSFRGAIRADNINALILGDLENASISITNGRLRKLFVVDDMVDSVISGGYDLGQDGRLGGGDDQLFSGADIDLVKVGGHFSASYILSGIAPNDNGTFHVFDADEPADLRSGSIGHVIFGGVIEDNGGVGFGIAAHSDIGRVQVGKLIISEGKHIDFNVLLY